MVACAVIVAVPAVRTRRRAEAFLSNLRNVELGPQGYEKVRLLWDRFHADAAEGAGTCTPSECILTVNFQNTWLRRLRLATWTEFGATLSVHNGNLYDIRASMKLYSRKRVIGAETILSDQSEGAGPPFRIITKRWSDNAPWQAIVQLTSHAAPAEREKAFAFNLGCLDKLGGCRDSSDLLPAVWSDGQNHHSVP